MLEGSELKKAAGKVRGRYPASGPHVTHLEGCAIGVHSLVCDCGLIFDLFRFGGVTGEGTEGIYPAFKADLARQLKAFETIRLFPITK